MKGRSREESDGSWTSSPVNIRFFPGFSRVARGGVPWLQRLVPDRKPGTTRSASKSHRGRSGENRISPMSPPPRRKSLASRNLWRVRCGERKPPKPGRAAIPRRPMPVAESIHCPTILSPMVGAGAERSGQVTSQTQGLTAPFFRPKCHRLQVLALFPARFLGPRRSYRPAAGGAHRHASWGNPAPRDVAAGRSLSKPGDTRTGLPPHRPRSGDETTTAGMTWA
jgi:hypothetical protein